MMMNNSIGDQLFILSIQMLNTGIQTFKVAKNMSMNSSTYFEKLNIFLSK